MSESRAGEPVTSPEPSPPPPSDAATASTVARDVPCVACNYNLRGLSSTSHCPECGKAAQTSLAPDRLIFANVAWLNRLRRGAAMIAFAHLGWFVAIVMRALGETVVPQDSSIGKVFGMAGFLEWFVVAVGTLGLIYCSKPEPSHVPGTRKPRRGMMLIAAFATIVIYTFMKFSESRASTDTIEFLLAIALLLMAAGNAAYATTCADYLRRACKVHSRWITLAISVGSAALLCGWSFILFAYHYLDSSLGLVFGFILLFVLVPAYLVAGGCHVYVARVFYQTLRTAESLDHSSRPPADDEPTSPDSTR